MCAMWWPWYANMTMTVYSRPMRARGEKMGKKRFSRNVREVSLRTAKRVTIPASSGMPRYCELESARYAAVVLFYQTRARD